MAGNTTNSVSEQDAFQAIIVQAGLCSRTKSPEYVKCLQQFLEDNAIKDCEEVQVFFKAAWKRYKVLKSSKLSHANILDRASKNTQDFERFEKNIVMEPEVKAKRKSFTDLGTRMKKARTDDILQTIDSYVKRECPELSTTQLLGYLIHRINVQSHKDIADVGLQLFTETVSVTNSFSIDEAIAIMHSLTLSKEQMRKLRHLLSAKGVYFPTTNELLEGRAKLRPVITPVLDGLGVEVQYKKLVKMTVESTLRVALKGKSLDDSGDYEMVFKDGGDGAGSQTVWNSTSMNDYVENMFQYGLTPLKLLFHSKSESKVLWMNHAPNSCRSLRPVFLVREKETDEDLLKLVIPTTDQARAELAAEGICATYQSDIGDQAVDVKILIHDTMKDLKFKRHISGLGGADCILCISKQEDWVNPERVVQGFAIERTAEDTLKLYHDLVNGDDEVCM